MPVTPASTRYESMTYHRFWAAKAHGFLRSDDLTPANLDKVRRLNGIARQPGQTLAQMAVVWVLRQATVTSAVIGASRVRQIEDGGDALQAALQPEELGAIETILAI